jgi:predicted dehydrogenase
MKKLRLGIIGTCRRGRLADYAHHPEDGVEIVAGADVSASQLERFAQRYREKFNAAVTPYLSYEEMLDKENLDGVFITSPDFCHEEQAAAALNRKVNVYLEKPMAITVAGCDRIMQTAYENKAKLMLGHNMRYMSFIHKMKEIIESGMIGEVKAIWCRHFVSYGGDAYFRDWHAEQSKANSLLLQKGSHDIDIIHWLAGAYTSRVCGFGSLSVYDKLPRRQPNEPFMQTEGGFDESHWPPVSQTGFNPVIDVEDINMINMQLSNGIQASYMQCHFTPDSVRNYTVIGTKGRLENYGDYHEDTVVEVWTERKDRFRLHGDVTFRTPSAVGGHGGADPKIINGFVEMLRGISKPNSTPQAARYSVATGCLGADSIRAGGTPFFVPPLPDHLEQHDFSK